MLDFLRSQKRRKNPNSSWDSDTFTRFWIMQSMALLFFKTVQVLKEINVKVTHLLLGFEPFNYDFTPITPT